VEFLPDDRWVLRDKVVENLRVLARSGLTFDLVIFPRHLPAAAELLRRVPGLPCVVDHLAKPPIRERRLEPWASQLRQVAAFPNVLCKLSGIPTEADHARWTTNDVAPYVRHAVDCFGWDRVMWGSDWPVCLLACDYGRTMSLLEEVLGDELTRPRREALFATTAARFYRLDRGA
jgi:L-fuconolactonase